MAGTRSSSRIAAQTSSPSSTQNQSSPKQAAGTKRKQDTSSSPVAKRGRKSTEKEQKTLEETLNQEKPENTTAEEAREKDEDSTMTEEKASNSKELQETIDNSTKDTPGDQLNEQKDEQNGVATNAKKEGASSEMDDTGKVEPTDTNSAQQEQTSNGDNAVDPSEREDETPSSILEKGIIYFFFRGRVGIDEPKDVGDIARSYMVMRPLPHGAKLGQGTIGDDGNCRLLALPKKVLPVSGRDRFMTFVEAAQTSFADLKKNFFPASDYATKTAGTRHTPATTPVGEGIYAITTTGRESHLAYILTIPAELGEVQKDIGLRARGSFITSTKNPQYPGPANTNLPAGPQYPKEVIDEFRSLRWLPSQPKHLDYINTQFLLIGESQGDLGKAVEQQPGDEQNDKETPLAEMEKLEGEDEIRVKHLKGNDAVFADLGLSSSEYPKLQSTW